MNLKNLGFALILGFAASTASAQDKWETIDNYITRDSTTKKGFTLIFVNVDTAFSKSGDTVKQRMTDAFFKVYPKEVRAFNKKAMRKVTFVIDPFYKGVAAASGGVIRFNPEWMLKKPLDLDVVTHEVMHLVQEYGYSAGPVWLTEGIADYVRFKFGIANEEAKWSMPEFKATQHYQNSYRITGRFFVWVEKNKYHNLVKDLDNELRSHTYSEASWKNLTGSTLDELWASYAANPRI
jgi:hypothetical protein